MPFHPERTLCVVPFPLLSLSPRAGLPVLFAIALLVDGFAHDLHGDGRTHAGKSPAELCGRRRTRPRRSSVGLVALRHGIPCLVYSFRNYICGQLRLQEFVFACYLFLARCARRVSTVSGATVHQGNWPTNTRPVLEKVSHAFAIFFVCYITLVVFAIIRVLLGPRSGVFCGLLLVATRVKRGPQATQKHKDQTQGSYVHVGSKAQDRVGHSGNHGWSSGILVSV